MGPDGFPAIDNTHGLRVWELALVRNLSFPALFRRFSPVGLFSSLLVIHRALPLLSTAISVPSSHNRAVAIEMSQLPESVRGLENQLATIR